MGLAAWKDTHGMRKKDGNGMPLVPRAAGETGRSSRYQARPSPIQCFENRGLLRPLIKRKEVQRHEVMTKQDAGDGDRV